MQDYIVTCDICGTTQNAPVHSADELMVMSVDEIDEARKRSAIEYGVLWAWQRGAYTRHTSGPCPMPWCTGTLDAVPEEASR